MRILMVTHTYPPFGLAGVERVTERTAVALSAQGHSVTVLARRPTPAPALPSLGRSIRNGVDVALVSGGGVPPGGPFPGHEDRVERIFERLLLELLPDVVVIGHLMTHSPGYIQIAHRWHIPVVMELHDFYSVCERAHLERPTGELCEGPDGGRACARHCFTEHTDAAGRWAMRTHLFNLALTYADALICPSQFVADYYRRLGIDSQRLQVVPNGIPFATNQAAESATEKAGSATQTRRPREEPLHFASLAVVSPHKGQHVVVEALRKARLPKVRYTLFGALTQPYTRHLRETADGTTGVELRTYGAYEPSMLPNLLGDVDAVIVPSLVWETFSIVAREAMACGVPVIASRLGALPEAVREGKNGLLFNPHLTSELAELILGLDTDRSRLAEMRAGIRDTDWITVQERTRRLGTVLEQVCAQGTKHGEKDADQPDLPALRSLLVMTK